MQFYQESLQFLDHLFTQLYLNQIEIGSHEEIDHLCYRTQSEEDYRKACAQISEFGHLLIESPVNGRLISTYKLISPIKYRQWTIDLVEVPAPKPNRPTSKGFEHIEIVTQRSFAEIQKQYPHLSFETSGLKKDFNQELEIELKDCAIKFHHYSLENVIELERNQKVDRALKSSRVLPILREHHPLVSGNFPLGLGVSDSDLDILIESSDFKQTEKLLKDSFSQHPQFQFEKTKVQNEDSLLAQFTFEDVPFEIFCQKTPPIQQRAHFHFLIEARLLKIFGQRLKDHILQLKQSGLKTEPAFAQALKMSGDPYESLLKLSQFSEAQLREGISYRA